MSYQVCQVQADRFFDVAFGFFKCLALSMAAGKCRNERNIPAFSGVLIKDRV